MKQQIVLTHRYTTLRQTEKLDRFSTGQHWSAFRFYDKITKRNYLCGHKILSEGVFVTQLSSYAGMSAWPILNTSALKRV